MGYDGDGAGCVLDHGCGDGLEQRLTQCAVGSRADDQQVTPVHLIDENPVNQAAGQLQMDIEVGVLLPQPRHGLAEQSALLDVLRIVGCHQDTVVVLASTSQEQ